MCTKWMQFNAGLERLDDIHTNSVGDQSQSMTNVTANEFTMYSILDELKLNDSQKPVTPNISVTLEPGYTGIGFISHIENELIGRVYILDIKSMPDSVTLFGAQPKRLTELPKPGEMFGYVFQEKYLVRAERLPFESYAVTNQTKQYSALLIDIGCVVRIDIKPTLHNHYEVTSAAQTIPPFAKFCQLVEIPSKVFLGDLLHTRVQYRVNFRDGELTFVNILRKGVNPFAADQQKEWHFYMYFLGHHMNILSSHQNNKKKSADQSTAKLAAVRPSKYDPNLNPFADPSLYNIKSIPSKPLIDKTNPFYFDLVDNLDEASVKPKFTNFQLTIVLNTKSNGRCYDNVPPMTSIAPKPQETRSVVEEKISNVTAHQNVNPVQGKIATPIPESKPMQNPTDIESNLRQNYEKRKTVTGWKESMSDMTSTHYEPKENNIPMAIKRATPSKPDTPPTPAPPISAAPAKQATPSKPDTPPTLGPKTSAPPISAPTPVIPAQMSKPVKSTPRYLPKIGEKIKVLYETMLSVEQFYAVIVDDPMRSMPVQDFSLMLNEKEYTRHLVPYSGNDTPKLFDKVFALYDDSFYRAKVINVIDPHVFKVFYVDYGNCEKVNTSQIYKYDTKWDEYPPYALHFRINGIKETNPWDNYARVALEQIMISECDATVVDIERCEKTRRTTYVVDLRDENRLNIAETLVHKNLATYTGKRANQPPVRQSKHA